MNTFENLAKKGSRFAVPMWEIMQDIIENPTQIELELADGSGRSTSAAVPAALVAELKECLSYHITKDTIPCEDVAIRAWAQSLDELFEFYNDTITNMTTPLNYAESYRKWYDQLISKLTRAVLGI